MRISLLLFFTVIFFNNSCTSTPQKSDQDWQPFVGTSRVYRTQLDNGLTLLVLEDSSSPTFAWQTWYNVGSRDEEVGYTGLAHLFEHMMFKQTKNLSEGEFDRILSEAGSEGMNAFTSFDYTAYVIELPKSQLELITKLEAERMTNLVVNKQSFETERDVVHNERRLRQENNPDGKLSQEFFAMLFQQHSYRWPIIGYAEDLDRMTEVDALDFYRKYYNPTQATIVVVGDVKAKQVERLVRKYYGNIPGGKVSNPTLQTEPAITSTRRKTVPLELQVEKLLVGWHIPSFRHPDFAPFEVLQGILSSGPSSRLSQALVETGVALEVDSGSYDLKDGGIYMISATLQKSKRAGVAEQEILKQLNKIKNALPTSDELQKAKNQIRFQLYKGLETNSRRARMLGRYEVGDGNFKDGLDLLRRIDQVEAKDLTRIVKQYFDESHRVTITGVPQ